MEKSHRKKKKQKVSEPGQVRTVEASDKDLSGPSIGQDGVVKVVLPNALSSLALIEGQDARPFFVLAQETELPHASTKEDQDQREQLRQTSGGEEAGSAKKIPSMEYLIHRKGLDGDLATGLTEGSNKAQLPPFILDEENEV